VITLATRQLYSFYIDPDLALALKALKRRDGTPESEAVRRGLRAFLKRKGVMPSRRGATQKP